MAEDSESAASQQSLELDDQDTCGIDGDNEEETEHAKGCCLPQPFTVLDPNYALAQSRYCCPFEVEDLIKASLLAQLRLPLI